MKQAWDNLFVLTLITACSFLMPLGVHAGDNRNTMPERLMSSPELTTSSGPRSSPYNPPTKDVFVTDSGPGLDTGCTFNDDPEHPLIIDVLVDRYVGEVDADGFLVNPQPLIDKGIIPARVSILMPAYDVDLDGESPPERDDVLFNGENLGSLIGFNSRWEYNSFVVNITKIKFPTKPAEGSLPTPVENRVQINVDVLGNSDWCTAIDWVALEIPIKPEFALTLAPKEGHNEIRVNDPNSEALIDTIYKQSFDADCNLIEEIGPIDEYPFSGPARNGLFGWFSGEVTLHTKIETCPADISSPPEVKVLWNIPNTGRNGEETWTGFENDITIKMPTTVGAYEVSFAYTMNDSKSDLSRKLFVTENANETTFKGLQPKKSWYQNAIAWATGITGEDEVLEKRLGNIYGAGHNWRYGYCFEGTEDKNGKCIGAPNTCEWKQLLEDPITCNYSDCQGFSRLLKKMANILGIGEFKEVMTSGIHPLGFLTHQGMFSLDHQFRGNAYPLGKNPTDPNRFDRYAFPNHVLQQREGFWYDAYYDVIFKGIYESEYEFIAYHVWHEQSPHYTETEDGEEGPILVDLGKYVYDSWREFMYHSPSSNQVRRNTTRESVNENQAIRFTGNSTVRIVDDNGDGFAEALVAEVEVEILTTGKYSIRGVLKKGEQIIATTPAFAMARWSGVILDKPPGIYTVSLSFSGEQIFRTGENGPYNLKLWTKDAELEIVTPAYDHTQFSEFEAMLTGITETAVDTNGNGKFDFLEATVEVNIRTAGEYFLVGTLFLDEGLKIPFKNTFTLNPGIQSLKLRFPGQFIRRSNRDGPYKGLVILDVADKDTSKFVDSIKFVTPAYRATDFEALLAFDATFNDQGIDTNNNGLFDLLQIDFEVNLIEAGTFRLKGELTDLKHSVYTDDLITSSVGSNTLTLNFQGPLIHDMEMTGPFEVGVIVQNPDTFEILDFIRLPRTAAYAFTEFEPLGGPPPAISLTSTSFDEGIDIDGNRLFDELHVKVDLELTTTDFYEWSARLMDANGTRIDADYGSSLLDEGTASIEFLFDGNLIGQNGIDGPFDVQGLLIYGQTGPNLAYSGTIAETQAYHANQFEGFVAVDAKKVAICHIPRQNPEAAHTITISKNALLAHLAHGDTEGPCPSEAKSKRYCRRTRYRSRY